MPASLERSGLASALKEFCKRIDGADGLEVVFSQSEGVGDLAKETELAAYRVVQELFANTLKYAEATRIELQLTSQKEGVRLDFKDNGKGFDYAQVTQNGGGLGLKNIASRLELIGGQAHFESDKGKGTRVLIILPAQKATE